MKEPQRSERDGLLKLNKVLALGTRLRGRGGSVTPEYLENIAVELERGWGVTDDDPRVKAGVKGTEFSLRPYPS